MCLLARVQLHPATCVLTPGVTFHSSCISLNQQLSHPSSISTPCLQVRLKRFLEMRGADGGPWRMLCALPALWVGLLYEPQVRKETAAV